MDALCPRALSSHKQWLSSHKHLKWKHEFIPMLDFLNFTELAQLTGKEWWHSHAVSASGVSRQWLSLAVFLTFLQVTVHYRVERSLISILFSATSEICRLAWRLTDSAYMHKSLLSLEFALEIPPNKPKGKLFTYTRQAWQLRWLKYARRELTRSPWQHVLAIQLQIFIRPWSQVPS